MCLPTLHRTHLTPSLHPTSQSPSSSEQPRPPRPHCDQNTYCTHARACSLMKIGFEKGILLDTITAFLEGHQPIGKMLRGVLTNASTLDEAIPMLEHTPLASPAYVTPLTVLVLLSVLLSVVLSVVLPVSLSASLSVLLFVAFCSTICTRFFVFRRTATHPLPPPTTRSRPHDSPPIAAHPALCTKHSFHCITRYLIVGGLDDGIVITRDRDGVATKSQDTSPFFFGREPVPPGVPCAR